MEKSVMPSIGLLMRMPFQLTLVCEGEVPRNATVDRVARPAFFTNTEELKVSTSAIERAMFSFSAMESKVVFCTPMSCIGRRAVMVNSSSSTVSISPGDWAAA